MTKTALVTGGTGTIGKALVPKLMDMGYIVYVMSRDDSKQAEMRIDFPDVRFMIGDITNTSDICAVMDNAEPELVVNAAALKHVPACEDTPEVAMRINTAGACNVYRAACEYGSERFIQISTDKAVYPISVLGMTKAMAERSLSVMSRVGMNAPLAVCRLGNVIGSRGSILATATRQLKEFGYVPITNFEMRRYWISDTDTAEYIGSVAAIEEPAKFSGVHVPVMLEERVVDMIKRHLGDVPMKEVGARFGEKLQEDLLWPWERK